MNELEQKRRRLASPKVVALLESIRQLDDVDAAFLGGELVEAMPVAGLVEFRDRFETSGASQTAAFHAIVKAKAALFNEHESTWAGAPREVLVMIFARLDAAGLRACSLTCRRWNELALPPIQQLPFVVRGSDLSAATTRCPSLAALSCRRAEYSQLELLTRLCELRELSLVNPFCFDVELLTGLTNLTTLCVDQVDDPDELDDLSVLSRLRELELKDSCMPTLLPSSLVALRLVRSGNPESWTAVLPGLTALTRLELCVGSSKTDDASSSDADGVSSSDADDQVAGDWPDTEEGGSSSDTSLVSSSHTAELFDQLTRLRDLRSLTLGGWRADEAAWVTTMTRLEELRLPWAKLDAQRLPPLLTRLEALQLAIEPPCPPNQILCLDLHETPNERWPWVWPEVLSKLQSLAFRDGELHWKMCSELHELKHLTRLRCDGFQESASRPGYVGWITSLRRLEVPGRDQGRHYLGQLPNVDIVLL
eukprot:TRINITY_DN3292_c0_g1_i2.p1 TRINITY_DN3292_c0_g1~~TRINITY_DN3292_c0_g1_i2.p1  ORF type:complete len:480 (-),score=59.96 TRINITY_DN3292_c0_g1_i2:272-1711(-)